jgi:hypothetical protein
MLYFKIEIIKLMNKFPYLISRNNCDYSDSYKNQRLQSYITATTASYAKELLHIISGNQITSIRPAAETTSDMDELNS